MTQQDPSPLQTPTLGSHHLAPSTALLEFHTSMIQLVLIFLLPPAAWPLSASFVHPLVLSSSGSVPALSLLSDTQDFISSLQLS